MKIKKKTATVYETSTGEYFEDIGIAIGQQRRINFKNWLEENGLESTSERFINLFVEEFDKIIELGEIDIVGEVEAASETYIDRGLEQGMMVFGGIKEGKGTAYEARKTKKPNVDDVDELEKRLYGKHKR